MGVSISDLAIFAGKEMDHVRALRDHGGGGLFDVGNAAAVLVLVVVVVLVLSEVTIASRSL
jgi:hypothetical protein